MTGISTFHIFRWLWLPTLIALALGVSIAQAKPEVGTVRFGSDGDRTRIVIDIKPLADAEARTLLSPPRLVVDLPLVDWQLRDHAQSSPRGFATAFRFGDVNGERSRLVVDLAAPADISSQITLPAGQDGSEFARIVIDLLPARQPPRPSPPDPPVAALPEDAEPTPSTVVAPRATAPLPRARPQTASPRNRPNDRVEPVTIAIDAGHGGIDPGAVATDGTLEKNITLAMARELASLLQQTDRYSPFLVRDDDSFIKLRERISRARSKEASIFLSIHADSIAQVDLRGASVYTLSETASDREAASLAAKENKADIIGGTDLSTADEVLASILIDLSQRSTNNESIKLADMLVNEIGKVTRLVKNTRRFAGFAVLKAPDMPSVLLELGYLSNDNDAARLKDENHRISLANAIIKALDRYFKANEGSG